MFKKAMALSEAINSSTCLYKFEQVEHAISDIAKHINDSYSGQILSEASHDDAVVVLTVMNGGMIFSGMLITQLNFLIELDYIHATRYANNKSGGELALLAEPKIELQNKQVLLVDDIFDDGITLARVKQYCLDRGAKAVKSAVLIYKDKPREKSMNTPPPEFIAMHVPDEFIFGMGMDAEGLYRNAPGIFYFSS